METDSMDALRRIAKTIVGRSQILKTCEVEGNGMCRLRIEECVFAQEETYCFSDISKDIDGFAYDVDRELAGIIGEPVMQCDKAKIKLHPIGDGDLLQFSYECQISVDDSTMERLRSGEWIIKE